MKANWMRVAVVFCLLSFTVAMIPAQALAFTIHVENPYSQTLSMAFIHYDDSARTWYTHGWHNIPGNSSKNIVIDNSTTVNKVYIYAKNSEATFGGEGYAQSISRAVISEKFGYLDGTPAPDGGSNYRRVYFVPYEITNGYVEYTP